MIGNKNTIALGITLSVLMLLPLAGNMAFAQYISNQGQTGLGDFIRLSEDRVKIANENPSTGSGTPMFAFDGVLGALVLSTVTFGGIAAAFFVRGTKGKYAAIGRG